MTTTYAVQYEPEETFTQINQAIGDLIERMKWLVKSLQDYGLPKLTVVYEKLGSCNKEWKEQRFSVAVVALTKAGKSTLINSWLGDEFLPVDAYPATACIVHIYHEPSEAGRGTLRVIEETEPGVKLCREEISGAKAINEYLKKLNDKKRGADSPRLDEELILEASLVSLVDHSLGQQKFEILDTPGPNEAGMQPLQEIVDKLLSEAHIIIFVLDYTKLKNKQDEELFKTLQEMRGSKYLEHARDRLFFVVNKVDQHDWNSSPLEGTVEYVVDMLHQQLGVMIGEEQIHLVSARKAILARLILLNRGSEQARTYFDSMLGRKKDKMTPAEYSKASRVRAQNLLEESQIELLEQAILLSISSKSGRLFLEGLLEKLGSVLDEFYNALIVEQAGLEKQQTDIQKAIDDLEAISADILDTLREATVKRDSSLKRTLEEIQRQTKDFENTTWQLIRSGTPSAAHPWIALVVDLFRNTQLEGRTQEELEQKISKIDQAILDYLNNSSKMLGDRLEQKFAEEQQQFIEALSYIIEQRRRRVEAVVEKNLQVPLKPIPFSFGGMQESRQFRKDKPIIGEKWGKVKYKEQEFVGKGRFLWWTWDKYHTVERTKDVVTGYIITREALAQPWLNQIKQRRQYAQEMVETTASESFAEIEGQARQSIEEYSNRYIEILKGAKQRAQSDRVGRLAQIKFWFGWVDMLREEITDYQAVFNIMNTQQEVLV